MPTAATASAPQPAADIHPHRPRVEVLSALPGRTRLRVRGLYRNPRLRERLERALARQGEISRIAANTTTGTLLLSHERGLALPQLRRLVELAGREPEAAPAANGEARTAWHTLSAHAALRELHSRPVAGLSVAEALARRARHGLNQLPESPLRSSWEILRTQFVNPAVGLLTASAGFSALTRERLDALVILGVVALNGLIGFRTEQQAEQVISGLRKLAPRLAQVRRERRERELDQRQLVPGDILLLAPGDAVAADARLLTCHKLDVDESTLTGESLPVRKHAALKAPLGAPLADRDNMVFMGTRVTGGTAVAVVVDTGRHTQLGEIQTLADAAKPPQTPLQRELEQINSRLVYVGGAVGLIAVAFGLARRLQLPEILHSAVALAVAVIPEGLPTVATTTLAMGIRRLRRQQVSVRQLDAVEGLGAITVLALDKTGTLTANRMTITDIETDRSLAIDHGELAEVLGQLDGDGDDATLRLLQVGALCSDSEPGPGDDWQDLQGSATENALIEAALAARMDVGALRRGLPRYATEQRAEDRPYMVTFHRQGSDGTLIAVKGAPAEVLALCRWRLDGDGPRPLDAAGRRALLAENERMAAVGLRVLGFAYAERGNGDGAIEDLTWLGLVGMSDPIRPGVERLIQRLHRAGIETVMITGDQTATARAIGEKLRLSDDEPLQVIDATTLHQGDGGPAEIETGSAKVFARVSPAEKLHIVRAFQRAGAVVAMTGDGINDSPALKAADVGVAMGLGGTEAARAMADVVIENDDLDTLLAAVEGGRAIYSNIRKAVRFLLSTNLSEVQLMLGGIALNIGKPLTPMQLLWINLITDIFPGLALAAEPVEPDVLGRPPRDPQEPIISRDDLLTMNRESAVMAGAGLAAYLLGRLRHGPGAAAGTKSFMTLTVAQLLHAYGCRSQTETVFDRRRPGNPYLNLAVGGALGLQVLANFAPPLRRLLGTVRLGPLDLLLVGLLAALPLLVNEALKAAGGNPAT